ncbi:MAG TPA: phytanoyl-CoA dioxygenase family protein [Chthonomonadaceae bacterium]|nr:phytanoyl-CoA dioxygenase family protein [Chthonomonadaceae bacterium]
MDIKEALYELGVRDDTITPAEKEQLDQDGYLPLKGILSPEQVEAIKQRQTELLEAEGDKAGTEVHQEKGTDRLSDLINKGTMFHVVITQPRVLACIAHVLDYDLKLSSLNSRNALPGQGLQGLHADWGRLETPGVYQVCNSMWLLDDFTPENGATRLVPGSQRSGKMPSDEMANPADTHPNEVVLLGKAGDVVVVNSHTWHGGTLNRTQGPRRVMHGYFCRRHQPQQLDQQKYLRRETWDQLSEAARVVLGVTDPGGW